MEVLVDAIEVRELTSPCHKHSRQILESVRGLREQKTTLSRCKQVQKTPGRAGQTAAIMTLLIVFKNTVQWRLFSTRGRTPTSIFVMKV